MRALPAFSFANVTSALALFVALGGTGYAVAKPPKNSVGTAELRDAAVTGAKLAPGVAVSGPRGPRGAEGPTGAAGATGPAGPSDVINVRRPNLTVIPANGGGNVTVASVTLPAGNWSLDAITTVGYEPPSPGSEWFSCALQVPGQTVAYGIFRVGTDAEATHVATIPLSGALSLTAPTTVSINCAHPSTVPPAATASEVNLRATRVGHVEQR